MDHFLRRYARPVILNSEDEMFAILIKAASYRTAFRRMVDGVLDQIAHSERKEVRVSHCNQRQIAW
ncbi:hypothetical protein D3C71_2153800 [compost metagenome]